MLASRVLRSCKATTVISRPISSWQIAFNKHGEPFDVLYHRDVDIGSPKNNEVLVNFRASPINPSDINAIQGIYPLKPTLPAVGGNEGAGYVLEVGPGVSMLKPGDLIIPGKPAAGTWRNTAIYNECDLIRLNPKLTIEQAAVLGINPSTSYLMLHKYLQLRAGDCVIQNGATSTTGIYTMQICKLLGVNTINIFRARKTAEATEATRKALKDFGGTLVVTQEELDQRTDLSELGRIRLGFDCLGGRPALGVMKRLEPGGIFVNYGGMTRQPIPTPVGALIFNDLTIRGFWLSGRDYASENSEGRLKMLNLLSDWMLDGTLKLSPAEFIPHTEWESALKKSIFRDETPETLPCKRILSFPKAL